MDESGDQNTKIDGDNNTVNNIQQSAREGQIILTEEIYKESLENAVRVKELEMQATLGKEREIFQAQIDELKNSLANLPESLKKEQEKNAELVALLEQREGKIAEKKFQKAIDAIKENEFAKADKILIEIEAKEKLSKKEFGIIAHTRGEIAEQDIRWHDAAKHFARAAQINPCYRHLILAEKFAVNTGDYDSALSFGEEAKKAAFKEHGEDTEEYATSLNNLGKVYSSKKQYKKAELFYDESLKIRQDKLGKKHPDVAQSLNNLGGIYQKKNQHRDATHFFKKALNIHKEILGLKHRDSATTLNNLGAAYRELGELKEAKPLIKRALKIRKEILGDNHPETANSYNNLGGLYCEQEKYTQALPMFQQALEILEATLGLNHPDTKQAKNNYELLKKDMANN